MKQEFKTEYEKLFYQALRVRLVEERCAKIYPTDMIQSPVHLSIGQEHISVGVCAALKKDDLVFGSYRGHALYLAKGGSLKGLFAELFGKVSGCGRGKAGSMHLSDHSIGMMGASAIVASTIPHAVGAALAAKVRKTNQVATSFFGEGATGEGVYHEALNFAAAKKLPVLFVCENNDLSIYTKVSSLHSFDLSTHAKAYGISGELIANGNDLDLIAKKSKQLVESIRAGKGPCLMAINTYRYRQHVGPDEDYEIGYRDRSELDWWQNRDPLIQNTLLVKRFQPSIEAEIDEAVKIAEQAAFPDKSELYKDVY